QHGRVQARIFATVFPRHLGVVGTGALFDHLLVRDVDFGVTVDALDASAEFFAFAAIPGGVQDGAQRLAQPAFGDLGAVSRPVGFDQASLGAVGADGETGVGPEVDHLGKDFFGRAFDHQPAQVAVALDTHVFALRQHIGGLRGRSHLLLPLLL